MNTFLERLIEDPSLVFAAKSVKSADALSLVKEFLDPIASSSSVLDEIYTDGLDSSQVWGQVKLVVDGVNDKLLVEQIPTLKEKFGVIVDQDHSAEEDSQEEDEEADDSDASGDLEEQEQESGSSDQEEDFQSLEEEEEEEEEQAEEIETAKEEKSAPLRKPKKDAFGLNDGFFDIDEFNRQVLAQEENGGNDGDDDEIDYFADMDDEDSEEEEVAYHDDFFNNEPTTRTTNNKNRKLSKEDEEEIFGEDGELLEQEYDKAVGSTMLDLFADDDDVEDDDDDEKVENLSTFEKQQREIQKEIAKLEQEAVADKKWALKGESKAKDRPSDSLLNEELEFERTAKPVPVITQEVTESIEELIRRRIKDQQFDELERKMISDVAKFNKSRKFELSEEKSSKSLAEQYEDVYQGVEENSKTNEELERAHQEISQLFQSLTHKLDSLCSAHFIPKPAQKALDVKVDTDTISMEDAQPLTMSNSTTLAPQELFNVKTGINNTEVSLKSGLVISKDELSRDEKQRLRRLNKRKKSKEFKNRAPVKKSKKNEVIDTLSKAKNLTVINNKGEKRDVQGNLVKEKKASGSSSLKL